MKRAFFLNFACEEGKITGSRLVLRLLSNSLCYREVVAKKFSVTMTSRFEIADEEYIEELKDKRENQNTKKSTEYWKNVFKKWANERNFQANLEEYKSDVLDQTLSQFYAELRKENGDDYEPDCLKVIQASLARYLKSKAYPKSIIRDREFLNSRKVLEGKARKLREQGKGKRPNRSRSLTKRIGRSPLAERPARRRHSTSST